MITTNDEINHRRELLEHIIRLGVTDRREIRWKEVALNFPNKTSAALVRFRRNKCLSLRNM